MADPLIALVVQASTRGWLSLKNLDFSARGWTGLRLRLQQARRSIDAQVAELHVLRLCAELQISSSPQSTAGELNKQIDRLTALLRPSVDRPSGGSRLDLIAKWYIMNAPGRLKTLGVDLGDLEPVLARGTAG